MRILGDQKIFDVDRSLCAIRYVDRESPKCMLGTDVQIPFDAYLCNVLFLASLDGMGFYSVDDDSLGFCVDSSGDYIIVHIKCIYIKLNVNIYSVREGSWSTSKFLKYRLPDTMSVEAIGQLVSMLDELHMLISIGMFSIDVQLSKLQNETWSKVFSCLPSVSMPLMNESSMHYVNRNSKLIIV
ncbi:hypothetical protein Hanom_Chr16g01445171 [Helianthus anomalus]